MADQKLALVFPTKSEAPDHPLVVAQRPRNDREIVWVALDRFTIDLRSWWRGNAGIFGPGRDGLTLAVRHANWSRRGAPARTGPRTGRGRVDKHGRTSCRT